jgi:glycosyltransferase involved in cell wall biosynthesis
VRIALIGTRGVPSVYGGFETCAEQLGIRLVERGHEVTVYCRSHFIDKHLKSYKGMRLVTLPTIKNKYLDTLAHTFVASVHAMFRPYDVCLYFIAGNSPVCWIPRLAGKRTVINVDGLDWKREKWPGPAKRYIRFAERLSTILPNATITDSHFVQRYYSEVYNSDIHYISYGSELEPVAPGETLRTWGLEPRKYILFVGRLVPENHPEHLVDAFHALEDRSGMKCVIVGDASYQNGYIAKLRQQAAEDVVFTGYVFGEGYRELSSNAYAFVETSSASGTHPALLEAMGFGNCVVVNDSPENLEAMGEAGFAYCGRTGAASLSTVLQELIHNPGMVERYRTLATKHVSEHYSWETVADNYVALFKKVLAKSSRMPASKAGVVPSRTPGND